MEITKRQTLLECLDLMTKFRNSFSHKGMGISAIERYQALYEEYDRKCEILREMIRALESEPVRRALADWQRMELPPAVLTFDGEGKDGYPERDEPDHTEEQRVSGGQDPVVERFAVEYLQK